jgi:hypothetical protein
MQISGRGYLKIADGAFTAPRPLLIHLITAQIVGESANCDVESRLVMRNPRKVAAENVDCESCCHQECANPEAPVAVHPLPVGAGTRFTVFTTLSLVIVLISGHISSPFCLDGLLLLMRRSSHLNRRFDARRR